MFTVSTYIVDTSHTTKIFAMLRRIFRKLHSMNRRSFLYILAKLHAKIIKSKQDSTKSFVYYNVAGACRLHDVLRTYTYVCIFKNFIIYSAIPSSYIPQNITIRSAVILIFLQSFNRKYKKIDKI